MAGQRRVQIDAADPGEASFTMASSPFYWLGRVVHRYSQDLDSGLKRIGMDVPRWRVLMTLKECEPASVTELAEHGVIKMSTMTKTVQRLQADGLVETAPKPSDGRVTEVRLTSVGRETLASVRMQASRVYRQALEGIDDPQLDALLATLRRMFSNLDR